MPLAKTKTASGINPAWANLPRRRCDDCGKAYKPVRPLKDGQRGFCCDNCRKSYHKHGGAYRKLKGEMVKMVTKEFGRINAELKELRALWIETEERYVQLAARTPARATRLGYPQSATQRGQPVQQARAVSTQTVAVSPLPNPQRRG